MEDQHAVPQDITGFKFKLVGDMTLKQFGELAFGAIMAYLFYISNWHPLLKWPLAALFGFLGVALAFLPIEERPLDTWIINFLNAIYRPTYYVWKKDMAGAMLATTKPPQVLPKIAPKPIPEPALQPWTAPTPPPPPPPPPKVAPASVPPAAPALSVQELQKLRDEKLAGLKKKAPEVTTTVSQTLPPVGNVLTIDKLTEMREKRTPPQPAAATAPIAEAPWTIGATGQMRVVDRPVKARPTISLTETPNVINGTVFDQRGGPMEGVILIIKDKAGNSVRALKTNRVGQFIVSTPLPSGAYFLEFEMPNYVFNTYEINLDGQVIKPLEIRGKFVEPAVKSSA